MSNTSALALRQMTVRVLRNDYGIGNVQTRYDATAPEAHYVRVWKISR